MRPARGAVPSRRGKMMHMAAHAYSFSPFTLDAASRRLTRDGEAIVIAERHFDVLVHLVSHAGDVLSKNALVEAGWRDVAVTDNSLEQAISTLRRALGPGPDGQPCIQTLPRQGYRFTLPVTRLAARTSDAALDAMLEPHRAWIEGRAALETLERDAIVRARASFEQVLSSEPEQASVHIGLANACAMQFEMTRTDAAPDVAALTAAVQHAREACRLDSQSGEAWATLGFVLDRAGQRADAAAASRRAVSIEPDNWRHHLRLAYGSWGDERLRAARRTLALLPAFPIAHWLAATVHVARQALGDAARELRAGIDAFEQDQAWQSRFSAVGLYWLQGLIALAHGQSDAALEAFERELALETRGHLYARECCANTWYAIGALRLRQSKPGEARVAFGETLHRVATHPMARLALGAINGSNGLTSPPDHVAMPASLPPADAAMVRAGACMLAGAHADAARIVAEALAAAPPGTNAGWTLPVEPLLNVGDHLEAWAPALARLRARAA